MKSDRNGYIDCFKAVACILVVFLHCPFPGQIGLIIQNLAGFAVPFFFIVAGWGSNREDWEKHVIKHIRYLLLIFILSCLFYTVFITVRLLIGQKSLVSIVQSINIYRILILNDLEFCGSGHLWFVMALIYCYGIFWVLKRIKLFEIGYFIAGAGLALNVIIRYLTGFEWHMVGNWFAYGIPFFFCGYYISTIKNKFSKSFLRIALFLSILISISVVFTEKMSDLYMIGYLSLNYSRSNKTVSAP